MSIRQTLPAVLVLLALGSAACTTGAAGPSATGSAAPSVPANPTVAPSPSSSPLQGGIVHPTGADEIVLRMDEAGGFTPPEWQAARIPYFSLYGDGRVVFLQTTAELTPREDNVFTGYPLRTAVLTEEQIQVLLEFALADGGLAVARADYQNPMVADAPTAVFTISAEDDTKSVSVVALGMDPPPGPDAAVIRKLALLGERLRDFDQGGTIASEPYVATAYRGVTFEQQGVQGVAIRPWPWEGIAPADFEQPKNDVGLPHGTRTLTPEEAAAVGVEGFEHGISTGVYLTGPDDKLYSLVIRPLLPDEDA